MTIVSTITKFFLAAAISFSMTVEICGQITYTNTSFPAVGDTLKSATAINPQVIDNGTPGADKVWDFTDLDVIPDLDIPILDPSEGVYQSVFPEANLLVRDIGGQERYLLRTETEFSDFGLIGSLGIGDLNEVKGCYSSPNVLQRAPLSYEDSYSSSTDLTFAIAREEIPDTLLEDFSSFDSMRLVTEIEQEGRVDAYGSLMIPGGEYEVLRDHRIERTNTKLEIKIGIFWTDASIIGQDILPGILGRDTIHSYYYLAEGVIEPIALVTTDNEGEILSVDLKREEIVTSTNLVQNGESAFVAFPNPVFRDLKISYQSFEPGQYTLRIFNILGEDVLVKPIMLAESGDFPVDVTNLRRGSYFYSLISESGQSIGTKRLIVIRP